LLQTFSKTPQRSRIIAWQKVDLEQYVEEHDRLDARQNQIASAASKAAAGHGAKQGRTSSMPSAGAVLHIHIDSGGLPLLSAPGGLPAVALQLLLLHRLLLHATVQLDAAPCNHTMPFL
jgi:hypothetical protein